jgi:hypothetical protein
VNNLDVTVSKANTWYIRYAPPASKPGAHGSGYWVAYAQWQSSGPAGVGGRQTTFSNVVKLSG